VTSPFKIGDKVYHRNLRLKGVVVKPPFLGVDEGYTELVDFEDGDTREVSIHLLDKIEEEEEEEAQ
jgi:heat shock protein HspQ